MYVKQSISFFESGSGGRLDLTVGPKQTMGKTVECFVVTIHMPKAVLSASLVATQGSYTYDPATKVTTWGGGGGGGEGGGGGRGGEKVTRRESIN